MMKDNFLESCLNQRLIGSLGEYLKIKQKHEDLCVLGIEKRVEDDKVFSSSILTSFDCKNVKVKSKKVVSKKIPSDIYSDSETSQFNS